jgi:putative PIN family toxin of toxin-antitoxin system
MRIVLDTNIFVASLITRGVCRDLVDHCIRRHNLLTSEFILNEFREALVGKFGLAREQAEEATSLPRSRMEVVAPAALASPVSRDASDDLVLGTAIGGGAACIVTGDNDLLVLKRLGSIDILSPAEFPAYEAAK